MQALHSSLCISFILVTVLTTTGCGRSKYATYGGSEASQDVSDDGAQKLTREYNAVLPLHELPRKPLDVTWVIDNSTSMNQEAAHVRRNFSNFIAQVQQESSLKLALISRAGTTGADVKLPARGPHFLQIDRAVWSTDSLEITGATLCPPSPTEQSACGMLLKKARIKDVTKLSGKLQSFLRADSKKVFVFVTDDESRLPAADFASAFSEVYPNEQPVVFGFVGLSTAASPCAVKPGAAYSELAVTTQGTTFNVCDRDWTKTFKELVSQVTQWATAPIAVPDDLKNHGIILSVEFDGIRLKPSQYTLTEEGLIFDPSLIQEPRAVSVKIRYEISEP